MKRANTRTSVQAIINVLPSQSPITIVDESSIGCGGKAIYKGLPEGLDDYRYAKVCRSAVHRLEGCYATTEQGWEVPSVTLYICTRSEQY